MTNIPLSAVFVIAAFLFFIIMMFRGMHQLIACLITVLITCIASQDGFMTAFFTDFMSGCATGFQNAFLLMLSGGLFGCAMSASGMSDGMGRFLVQKLGAKNAPYVVMAVTILACLGGSPVYVFIVGAVAVSVMSEANLPMYLALAAMSGSGVLISFCMPGFAGLPNVIPTMYLGTNLYAGAAIGWLAVVVGEFLVFLYVTYLTKKAIAKGDKYEANAMFDASSISDDKDLPNFALSITPVILIIVLCAVFQNMGMGAMPAVVVSQFAATVFIYITCWNRIDNKLKPIWTASLT